MPVSRISVISSDGHVAARMPDYRTYLDPAYVEDFDAFLREFEQHGVITTDPTNIAERLDPEIAVSWQRDVAAAGRLDATWNPARRITELDREGITAELLFQDFATPFVMSSPTRRSGARWTGRSMTARRFDPAQPMWHPDGSTRRHPQAATPAVQCGCPYRPHAPAHAAAHVRHHDARRRGRPARHADRGAARRSTHHDAL
jgi:hypothetical protein